MWSECPVTFLTCPNWLTFALVFGCFKNFWSATCHEFSVPSCGGGREAMFLLKRGWRVFAVDIHDDRRFQTILKSLGRPPVHWGGNGFDDRCHYSQLDLETDEGLRMLTKECANFAGAIGPAADGNNVEKASSAAAQLVWVGRYLHRPLLPIIRDCLVAPGGAVIYHTFCKGCEKFGRPKKVRCICLTNTKIALGVQRPHVCANSARWCPLL